MARVLLITTGECEHQTLGHSLRRFFPEVAFDASPRHDGFTSRALPMEPILEPGTEIMTLAADLVAAVEPGERRRPYYDLVLVVEDLELANKANHGRVVQHMREAVRTHIDNHAWPSELSRQKAIKQTKERCSFHLFCPMLEAYFFGEPDEPGQAGALKRAGALRSAAFDSFLRDVEDFSTDDPDYVSVPNGSRYLDGTKIAWATPDRAHHPKNYLRFLCDSDTQARERRPYRETKGGCQALQTLDWSAVLAPSEYVRFARSMMDDLADGLGVPNPFPKGALQADTALKHGLANRVLRNL